MMRLLACVLMLPVVVVACDDKGDDDDDDNDDEDTAADAGGVGGGGDWGSDESSDGGGDAPEGGSGGGALTACEHFVDAWTSCVAEFGGDPADYGLTDDYCDPYTDSGYDSLLDCYAAALIAGDCSTVEGYTAAATEAARCS